MKSTLAIIAVCLFFVPSIVKGENEIVTIRPIPPAGSFAPGETAVLTIELQISPPYHINSDRPLQDYLIPTTLNFEPQPGVTFGKPIFPASLVKKLPFSDSPMAIYEGSVNVKVEITPASKLNSKEMNINGKIRYQACNDKYCLRPVVQRFSLTFPVGQGVQTTSLPAKTVKTAQASVPAGTTGQKSWSMIDLGDRNLLMVFVLVFLGGLALNLTPCVYPMIPITITYFGGQAQGRKGSLIAHSFLYVIGMAMTYSILGVVAAMTGGLFGAVHQYPPVLVGIALVMILLALSMFDVYELRMPQSLNRLAGGSQKGFGGTFLMGLTVGIVAAPCIGPFVLGLLTYVGNRGNALLGFALFFVLALGLGTPFLFLGAFSGSIRRLPRSGAWMVWVRKIFGFVLLAMAVFFVKPLFPNLLAYQCTLALIMLLAGIYMAWIDIVPVSGKLFSYVRNAVGIVFFSVALYFMVTGLEASLESAVGLSGTESVRWTQYSDAVLSRASKEAKPVFIDFYADWCAPCKELDKHTYSAPEVIRTSKQFIMVKVDLTSADDPLAESLRKKFEAKGVPTLVFLTPDGREIPGLRGTGFETTEVFLEKMNKALQLSSNWQKVTT